MRFIRTACVVVILSLSSVAYAASVKIEGLPIKVGDTVEDVQKALSTSQEPEKVENAIESPLTKKETQIHLKTKGIWVFFKKGKVVTIRIEQPFSGSIGGVRLGDSSSKIEKTFGPATKHGTFGNYDTYTYYFDDVTTTRFTVNSDDEIEIIFFNK
jgi:hypothetical protein